MSNPLTPAEIKAALRKFGVKFIEHDGWETHDRRGHGDFQPIGFMVHHTGDDAPDDADFRVVWGGRSDLPGPLCHFGGRDDGSVDLCSAGRANHAGSGDSRVYDALVRSRPLPAPTLKNADGNTRFYGHETYYSGGHRPVQYAAMVSVAAAICDAHGWPASRVIGHREWTNTKIDPGSVSMTQFRADVAARIKAVNAAVSSSGDSTPAGGITMDTATSAAIRKIVAEEIAKALATQPAKVWGYKNPNVTDKDAYRILRDGGDTASAGK